MCGGNEAPHRVECECKYITFPWRSLVFKNEMQARSSHTVSQLVFKGATLDIWIIGGRGVGLARQLWSLKTRVRSPASPITFSKCPKWPPTTKFNQYSLTDIFNLPAKPKRKHNTKTDLGVFCKLRPLLVFSTFGQR